MELIRMQIVKGNLLNASEQYIAHQCNCITTVPHGISEKIFEKYPHANVYKTRCSCALTKKQTRNCRCPTARRDNPGTIDIRHHHQQHDGGVINMLAQYYPGTARFKNDFPVDRIRYFQSCLDRISEMEGLESVAFPFRIGCGLAGGDWTIYSRMLESFSKRVSERGVRVVIYEM
jgi:O-acetyl-ADP-ribose deacetylase (regulator of RNase III)